MTAHVDTRRRARFAIVLLVVSIAVVVVLLRRGPGDAAPDPMPTAADTLARERAAAWFGKEQQFGKAREEIAPLVARESPALEDLVRAAAIEYADGKLDAAEAFLARAAAIDADATPVLYLRGQIARESGDYAAALPFLRKAHEQEPQDLGTALALADVEGELDHVAEAEALYRAIIDVGIENGGNWYVSAVYRLARLLTNGGREAEAEPYNEIFRALEKRGVKQASSLVLNLGRFGAVAPPAPRGSKIETPGALPAFRAGAIVLPELAGARVLEARDLDGDSHVDLLAFGPRGLAAGLRTSTGWTGKTIVAGPVDLASSFDVDNDGDLDVLVVQGTRITLHTLEVPKQEPGEDARDAQIDATWTLSALSFPALPSPPLDVVAVDYDHEGDLDLVMAGAFGARVWRNDGAAVPAQGGAYVDASDTAELPSSGTYAWALTEDFDGDNDVDVVLGGLDVLFLGDSLRAGRFADQTARAFPAGTRFASKPVVADVDGDARPDVLGAEAHWLQQKDHSFRRVAERRLPPAPIAIDLDLDGALDVVAGHASQAGVESVLAVGRAEEASATISAAAGVIAAADFDGDRVECARDVDLAVAGADGVTIWTSAGNGNHGVPISYRGLRDNRRAVGAVVEYRAGTIYRRIYWRGEPVVVGLGKSTLLDVLRITWPNGTVSTELELDCSPQAGVDDPDAAFTGMLQPSGQVGSCPFLYTWNGETYTFVSDVLGVTPLGLPIAPGKLVPPDHDEYVLVRGDQLVPKDGYLELQLTEELREVTYLDRVELLAVDHPAGTEIHPNELFTFPPFPEAKIHVARDAIAPSRASGSDGKDYAFELGTIDDAHAAPFELHPPQFAGLAKPWFVELAFDPAAVRDAEALRLLMTGWFFWSDASANMASARHPGIEFVPPILQVPDGAGGWRDAGPPVGFPAGKTKTMVIDVTSILVRDDPRIRVFTTLRLYWDAIRLAVDPGTEETRVTRLEPAQAKLWRRGFSAPLDPIEPGETNPSDRPERFDWKELAPEPRWNQHPGLYTRYGETLPLLQAIDDRFVIFGAGDALTVRFDARALEAPPAGFTRDWLVFLDGWAKDRDPNTIEALEVEPLPFHAMSGYPYRADERFPDDAEHERWRAEWNTRPGHEWIGPVSPAREAESTRGE